MRVRMYYACYLYVCVCVCVAVYVCMLRVFCNTVCWRRAPRIGQACLLPQSVLFANNPAPLEGHAQASNPSQTTYLASQAGGHAPDALFPIAPGGCTCAITGRMHAVCDEHGTHSFKSDGLPAHRPWMHEVMSTRRQKISGQNSETINI